MSPPSSVSVKLQFKAYMKILKPFSELTKNWSPERKARIRAEAMDIVRSIDADEVHARRLKNQRLKRSK